MLSRDMGSEVTTIVKSLKQLPPAQYNCMSLALVLYVEHSLGYDMSVSL